MNAKESLRADQAAEVATQRANHELGGDASPEYQTNCALVAIALELRAARVYANYLEGRQDRAVPGTAYKGARS
jgi:hypothetical protein